MLRTLPLVFLGLCAGQGALADEEVRPSPSSPPPLRSSPHLQPTPIARSLTVYHRLVAQPLSSDKAIPHSFSPREVGKWYERGRIDIEGEEASFVPSHDAWLAFDAPRTAAYQQKNAAQVGGERYQVAVRDPAWSGTGGEEGELSFVSVDPVLYPSLHVYRHQVTDEDDMQCKLYISPSADLDEFLTLSWASSPTHGGVFLGALSYRTSTSDDSPACDLKASEKERKKYVFGPKKEEKGKMVVKLARAQEIKPQEPVRPKQAKEQQPVQLDEEGKVIPPAPEPGFIKKYWMYIVPVLLVFLMITSDPPAGEGGQGGGGGGKK
ncbi:hypothetical protein JCM11251_003875 [Rhodosporidiobolus azoricus]